MADTAVPPPDPPPPGRYVLTGAAGLIGSHVLARLADAPGVSVRAVFHRRRPATMPDNVDAAQADLTDPAAAQAAIGGAEFAIHCAGIVASAPVLARDPVGPLVANAAMACRVMRAAVAAGCRHLVVMSSITGYPDSEAPSREDDFLAGEPPTPWRGIGWTYRYVEAMARLCAAGGADAMQVTALRPSMVYGDGDRFDDAHAHFLPALMRRVVARERPIEVWGDGSAERDLVHADDVARAALLALRRAGGGFRAYNVGAGRSQTVLQILHALIAADGFADAEIAHRYDRAGSAARRRIDVARARSELGFEPAVGLDDGLARTLRGYRAGLQTAG
ncbi:MAG: NAD(P)-dependent oxidoreductase [Alphaproteobacteria bacterium]